MIQKDNKRRLKIYKKYGYKTLILWESEFSNMDNVLEKLGGFIKI